MHRSDQPPRGFPGGRPPTRTARANPPVLLGRTSHRYPRVAGHRPGGVGSHPATHRERGGVHGRCQNPEAARTGIRAGRRPDAIGRAMRSRRDKGHRRRPIRAFQPSLRNQLSFQYSQKPPFKKFTTVVLSSLSIIGVLPIRPQNPTHHPGPMPSIFNALSPIDANRDNADGDHPRSWEYHPVVVSKNPSNSRNFASV